MAHGFVDRHRYDFLMMHLEPKSPEKKDHLWLTLRNYERMDKLVSITKENIKLHEIKTTYFKYAGRPWDVPFQRHSFLFQVVDTFRVPAQWSMYPLLVMTRLEVVSPEIKNITFRYDNKTFRLSVLN